MLTKVFHHVVTFGFTVYQHVEPQTLLFGDRLFDMFRNTGAVVTGIQVALFEVQTQTANFGGLRE